jgi:uncharacterized SAM-binding protein YcdF (DUF218 family)
MFFPASKLLTALMLPSSIVALLIGAGVLLLLARPHAARLGKRLVLSGLALLLLLGIAPVGNVMLLPLERRAEALGGSVPAGSATGIILLGGFEEGWITAGRPALALNEAAERLTETVLLAKRHPAAKVVFTGGANNLLSGGAEATARVRDYLVAFGLPADRIVLEGQSRNTHENAEFLRPILQPKAGQRWLLVTSAYHMPRSVSIFRKSGFDVTAYPVDFRLRDSGDVLRPFDSIPDGLKRVDLAMREYAGLVAYWLTGRSESLWPAPRQ